mgnify:CR=1 FL=1
MSKTSTKLNESNDDYLNKLYQMKGEIEHVLSNPDTFIGSIEEVDSDMWILNDLIIDNINTNTTNTTNTNNTNEISIVRKNIKYIPGLFKLFDEGIVNCRDHVIRMLQRIENKQENTLPVTYIDISIQDDGSIIMINDGNGIDVVQHPEHKFWIPEMIFGHLRTSTNYNKDEKKIVGGKNGFGFKIVLIWSSHGSVETVDHVRGLKYAQEFNNNLGTINPPKITKCKTKPYTKITFKPDYKALGIDKLSQDMIALLRKRVYDIASVTDARIKVKYNNSLIPVKNFQQYIDLYIGDKNTTNRAYESPNERWEYAISLSPTGEFTQISFINGICTYKGGKHVEYILNQIVKKMIDYIEKKKKVRPSATSIKEQLMLFLRCDVENPAFDSQAKDYMDTPSSKFGSKCDVSDKFIEKIAKMGIMTTACAITDIKENKLVKKTDGSKTKNVKGIVKLTDANWAGTAKSKDCILILAEGDSAKSGIISGLSKEDRNNIGVYPLKGKSLNTRNACTKQISDNNEIKELKKIVGLESGKKYETINDVTKNLRYGKILFMTDQDLDGSHIKGLIINIFHSEWNSLIKIPGFIGYMNTPILKARKNTSELLFYNEGEYLKWKKTENTNGWKIKYYKGLGTSTGIEFKEYFKNKKLVDYVYNGNESDNLIDMAFNKKRANDRKIWIEGCDRNSFVDTLQTQITYDEFINSELIHFSKHDCDRNIPNIMDGLKTALRKVVYASFKRNLSTEIKVAQLGGYVSEHSAYHHGEASLAGAIIGLAQTFLGSNNINLLEPCGQFGTRLKGGSDNASPRYIFTRLSKITRIIFPQLDDNVLQYLNDDGQQIEPMFYAPILPMILINGTNGIGTGFSSTIYCYNPIDILNYLTNKLTTNQPYTQEFIPWYDNFTGTICKIEENKYLIKGKYEKINEDTIIITELPIGFWTEDFKELLETLADPRDKDGNKLTSLIKSFDDMSTDLLVEFIVILPSGMLNKLEQTSYDNNCNGIHKLFKLSATISTTNMHLFNSKDKLVKYNSVTDIIDDYFITRLELYQVRKDYLINAMNVEIETLNNKKKYIQEILNGTIDLRNKKKDQIIKLLNDKKYKVIDDDQNYKYLIKMPMDIVSEENIQKIFKDVDEKYNELNILQNTTIQELWLQELQQFKTQYELQQLEKNKNKITENDNIKSKPIKSKVNKKK